MAEGERQDQARISTEIRGAWKNSNIHCYPGTRKARTRKAISFFLYPLLVQSLLSQHNIFAFSVLLEKNKPNIEVGTGGDGCH